MPSNDDDGLLFDLSEFTRTPPDDTSPQTLGEAFASSDELDIPELDDAIGKELYALAWEVRKCEPWQRLKEDDWFAIRDPHTDEILVVSIMGMAEQNFAVQLYLPEEGIRFWNHVIDVGDVDPAMIHFGLRMIECEFANRVDLEDSDRAAHDRFSTARGLDRTSIAYAMFRSFRPGYVPWPIENEEAERIALALRLVPAFERFIDANYNDFYKRVKGARKNRPQIPLFALKDGGDPRKTADWEISSCPFPDAKPEPLPEAPRDDLFPARLAGLKIQHGGDPWECGNTFMEDSVLHEHRIVFPVTHITYTGGGMIAPPTLGVPGDCPVTLIRRSFAESAEAAGFLPGEVRYTDPVVEIALRDLASQRGFKLKQARSLPNFDELVEMICAGQQKQHESELFQQLHTLGPEFLQGVTPAMLRDLENAPPDVLEKLAPIIAAIQREESSEPEPAGALKYRQPTSASRYVMRIDLVGAKPPIWRRISMPTDASLFDLHCAIQDAMGWEDEHLHEFAVAKGKSKREVNAFDWQEELTTTLEHIVKKKKREILYVYDFGDSWEHKIKIEKTVDPKVGTQRTTAKPQPKIITGKGICPFEDCGGIWGWQQLLEGEHHFLDEWDEDEIAAFKEQKFEPSKVKFYPAAKLADGFIARGRTTPF